MRGGRPIPVRRKTWEVLVYLPERPGVLVTKDDLQDAVRPETSVTPDVLIRSIRELRLATAAPDRGHAPTLSRRAVHSRQQSLPGSGDTWCGRC